MVDGLAKRRYNKHIDNAIRNMMLLDYLKNVVKEVADAGSIKQTDLTVAVFGTSGAGNKHLVDSLFPHAVRKGLVNMAVKGRSKVYTVTDAGRAYLNTQTF